MPLAELLRAVDALAAGIGDRFAGRRVAVAMPSGVDALLGVLALLAADAIVVACNHTWWPRDLRGALEVTGASALFGSDAVTATCRDLCPTWTLGREGDGTPTLVADDTVLAPLPKEVYDDAGALVGLAGGTRGEPHPAMFTASQIASWAELAESPPPRGTLVVATEVGHLPTLRRVLAELARGGSVSLSSRWRPKHLIEELTRRPQCTLWATGTQVDLLLAKCHGVVPPLARVEAVGSPLFPATVAALQTNGVEAESWYTLTEAGGWVGLRSGMNAATGPTAGLEVTPGINVEVDDVDPLTGIGSLWVSGPAAGLALDGLANHWPSGDTGRWLNNGQLAVGARLADRFLVNGSLVDPSVVEAALRNHPDVAAIAVVARPDKEAGNIPVAVVVPKNPDAPPFLADMAEEMAELGQQWRPRAQWIVDTLPLAPTGALHRRLLTFEEAGR